MDLSVIFRVIVLIAVLCLCDSTPLNSLKGIDPPATIFPKSSVCYKDEGSTAMGGNVPDPRDCHHYYSCVADANGIPTPIPMECQAGHDGKPLYYDFRKCWCETLEEATCYEISFPDHQADFFKCAYELSQQETNNNNNTI